MSKVVITMPAYRAEETLAKTVADIPAGVADELILVDDASPDNTVKLARELGGIKVFVHDTNRGYGGNQKTCYRQALAERADIIVLLHPDYQYEPKAVPLLIAPILAGEADMTFGSRFAGLGDPRAGGMPIYRFFGNRLTTILQNLVLGSRFTEMHSGMRAYTRSCLLSIPFLSYSDDFAFDAQFLVDAVLSGQRVVEVPIPTRYTKESSSISIFRSLRYVFAGFGYALRQAATFGRKGKRWPSRQRSQSTVSGGQPAYRRNYDGERVAQIADRLRDFALDGTIRAASSPHDLSEEVAGAIVLAPLEAALDPMAQLTGIRDRIASEGLIAFGTRTPLGAVNSFLRGVGLRMIGASQEGSEHLVIARVL